jgi:putative ABC transport system substrate-binding protein
MRRRRILATFVGTAALPQVAVAQSSMRQYRLCWMNSASTRAEAYNVAFVARLGELGFAEGRNLVIDYRNAEGQFERLPALGSDLARQKCDAFLAVGPEATLVAAREAVRETPIVIVANDYDPVATGHITSMARPGGRITGVAQFQTELPAKRLGLLMELLPNATRFAVLADSATKGQLAVVREAAQRLDIVLHVVEFRSAPYDYEAAFTEFSSAGAQALLALTSGLFVPARRKIPALALAHRLPSMFNNHLWAQAGGLLTCGVNFNHLYRRAAEQVSLILKGARAADIPVEEPSAFELVANLKTARALGLTIPPSILARADEVIE